MSVPRGTKHGRRYFSPPAIKPKKKLEFLQRIVVMAFTISIIIVAGAISFNFFLLWNDKQPAQQEVVAAITTFGGIMAGAATFAYGGLNAVRAWSLNKYADNSEEEVK